MSLLSVEVQIPRNNKTQMESEVKFEAALARG
jgi:hypothetical protein